MISVASDWIIPTTTENIREIHRPVSHTELGEAGKEGSDIGAGKSKPEVVGLLPNVWSRD